MATRKTVFGVKRADLSAELVAGPRQRRHALDDEQCQAQLAFEGNGLRLRFGLARLPLEVALPRALGRPRQTGRQLEERDRDTGAGEEEAEAEVVAEVAEEPRHVRADEERPRVEDDGRGDRA